MDFIKEELILIIEDINKVKNSIYKNKIYMNPTKEQQIAFHTIITKLINKLESLIIKHKDLTPFKKVMIFMEDKDTEEKYVFFTIESMKKANEYYFETLEKENKNFITFADYAIFHSINIIVEKIYRELYGCPFDNNLTCD